eukprot:COSAG04_NODE_30453_length_262_cov_1.276074_1_plen_33_part_10
MYPLQQINSAGGSPKQFIRSTAHCSLLRPRVEV